MIIVNESNLESDPAEIMETSYGLLVNGAWAVCAWQCCDARQTCIEIVRCNDT